MSAVSFDRLLSSPRRARRAIGEANLRFGGSIDTAHDHEMLEGDFGHAKRGPSQSGKGVRLSRLLDKRTPLLRRFGAATEKRVAGAAMEFDRRQRAIVKVHYFSHASGGGAALKEHARYVARHAATRDDELWQDGPKEERAEAREAGAASDAESRAKAHAAYLARACQAERTLFYDADADRVDGMARIEAWARSDLRHFRIVLSPENGAELRDLPAYTREVMARAEAQLGTKLQWVAVDHWDTDNPHTHLIVRGRRANGQDLILPRDFIKHGFRDVARDAATEWLGPRSPADERLALNREVRAHAPTRLDRMIEAQLPENRTIRVAQLEAPNGDLTLTQALKARARELQRLGLASEVRRNVLAFEPDWRERLQAMELHLDIRKRIILERTLLRQRELEQSIKQLTKGMLGR